ncbi:LamG-like jellyroll fold domain-containing protein [Oricola sp.]|uniref:LamG-like jellyroll fold domain-containing protein n=1 Tax=Oricola sp. TaxID=1979950 RepID=UPI003BAB15BA
MLPGTMPNIGAAGAASGNQNLYEVLQSLGLTTNLEMCVDFGVSDCYPGSGQTVSDLSGNGEDFWRGRYSTSESADPIFNGTAGDLSDGEYFEWDRTSSPWQCLELKSGTPAWVDNLHKNNAAWTALAWVYPHSSASGSRCVMGVGLAGDSTHRGVMFRMDPSNFLRLTVARGTSGSWAKTETSTLAITENAWQLVAISLDEAAGASGSFFQINDDAEDTFNGSYSSPSSSGASHALQLGADDQEYAMDNGDRMAAAAILSTALTSANIDAIFNATKGRFGVT